MILLATRPGCAQVPGRGRGDMEGVSGATRATRVAEGKTRAWEDDGPPGIARVGEYLELPWHQFRAFGDAEHFSFALCSWGQQGAGDDNKEEGPGGGVPQFQGSGEEVDSGRARRTGLWPGPLSPRAPPSSSGCFRSCSGCLDTWLVHTGALAALHYRPFAVSEARGYFPKRETRRGVATPSRDQGGH